MSDSRVSSRTSFARDGAGTPRVCHIISGLDDGGAEGALYRLCVAAAGHAIAQSVVSLRGPGKYGPLLEAAGVRLYALDLAGASAPVAFGQLVSILRRERPAVVQTWMYHANLIGGLAARLAGCRNLVWGLRHGRLEPDQAGRGIRTVDWASARLSHALPRRIVSCSARTVPDQIALGYDGARIIVVPNGYDTTRFAPDPVVRAALRQELNVAANGLLLGMVGRWTPEKDHRNLLTAIATSADRLPDFRLVLVGAGMDSDNAQLGELLAASGLRQRVMLLGRRDDVPAVMNALDFHILSSSSEAFPNVVAEAMACGVPNVVTDVGDAALIVGETGWVVPRRQPGVLAEAIVEAVATMADSERRLLRERACRARIAREFSIEAMLESYLRVWDLNATNSDYVDV